MKWIIKSAIITDPNSPHNGKQKDVMIEDGVVVKIADKIEDEAETYSAPNLHLSPGWFDLRANFCDPGFEHREDICSGLQAARKGGFTGVAMVPSTDPPLSSKSQIEYVRNRARGSAVDLLPYGTISAHRGGEQLAELFDLKTAGAVAFTDDKSPVVNASLMSTALLYVKNFDGLVVSFPHEASMCQGGQIHEGVVSTRLGLRGLPALAEELMVTRDLYLCEYNNAKIHFTGISASGSVELIREAKAKGLDVTCDVYAHNLALTDEDLSDYDQHKKVLPPLRDENHRKALIQGLKDGTIDAICSDHTPEDVERKNVEFEHAAFGMIGLESCFGVLNKALEKEMSAAEIITKIAHGPRNILGLQPVVVEKDQPANFTLFDPQMDWIFSTEDIRSKSRNTPFVGTQLKGKALAVMNNGRLEVCGE